MFTYGSQVNPSLGRQDFSSILQGAQARAQGQIQAAQAQAQMYANIGSTIGNAIQTYAQKQEEKRQQKAGSEFVSNWFKNNPDLATSFKLPTDDKGQPDPKAINAVIESLGGLKTAIPSLMAMGEFSAQNKMRRLQLGEMERGIAEQERLRQALATPPAASAILAGARFEQLPTGPGAFDRAPAGTEDFLRRAQTAGIDPARYAQTALQLAQVQETLAQARERDRGKPKANVFGTPQEGLAEIKRLTESKAFPPGVVPVLKSEGGGYVLETIGAPTPPPGVESTYEQLGAKSAQAALDAYKQSFADAARAGQSGRLVVSALDKGAETGMFAPFKTIGLRILSEAAPGVKPELFEQELATKGIAALQAYGATGLARGLGSMSNADREFFVALFPSITDTKQLNRFYALMAAENEKFANEDRKFVRELEEKGVRQDKILRELEARIEGRNVAQSIYEKVTGGNMPAPPSSPSGGLSPSTRALIPSR